MSRLHRLLHLELNYKNITGINSEIYIDTKNVEYCTV